MRSKIDIFCLICDKPKRNAFVYNLKIAIFLFLILNDVKVKKTSPPDSLTNKPSVKKLHEFCIGTLKCSKLD